MLDSAARSVRAARSCDGADGATIGAGLPLGALLGGLLVGTVALVVVDRGGATNAIQAALGGRLLPPEAGSPPAGNAPPDPWDPDAPAAPGPPAADPQSAGGAGVVPPSLEPPSTTGGGAPAIGGASPPGGAGGPAGPVIVVAPAQSADGAIGDSIGDADGAAVAVPGDPVPATTPPSDGVDLAAEPGSLPLLVLGALLLVVARRRRAA
ncbi:PEP motif putative anchor domain protein [Gemmatirosa kalamazoonensis]|uniref:PEP motif putative anchor domain protein n=1 Tax=Gemmatirosa kalamazoonensis TaxID=861299 RepID=W0RN63_9BACT|nr:PEP-CTERM sorting domain-containing protein [Gemmatirosa kalamazoonensis]AHG91750.1 PEP motif putative anchor domain protein [Gemmatirosa kalamazoonensis]